MLFDFVAADCALGAKSVICNVALLQCKRQSFHVLDIEPMSGM